VEPPTPDGMHRGPAALLLAVLAAAAASSLLCAPAAVADTVSADVLPDGEVELRVSAGNVTAKRTSFTSPDTGYVVLLSFIARSIADLKLKCARTVYEWSSPRTATR